MASFLVLLPAGSRAQDVALVPLTSDVANPTFLTHAGDGSARLFITSQEGIIHIHDGADLLSTPFLDIQTLVACCSERGLFSVAFHPDYTSNGFFFIAYSDNSGDTVLARYSVSANPNVADASSGEIVLTLLEPAANHNGGQLAFGPDGYLYFGAGDGGGSGDPFDFGQDLGSLHGKLLRLDVDSGLPYAIPPDNPYVGETGEDEIWASGLRNPWRFSFDRLTGDLFIADVGQNRREEIDFQPVGSVGCENYGWRWMEGSLCFNPSSNCQPGPPSACNPTGRLTLPILEYSHSAGRCAVTGGFRYRGSEVPEISGQYLYGDYCTGEIWGATEQPGERARYLGPPSLEDEALPLPTWTSALLVDAPALISSFGEDEAGELYVLDRGGEIYRITSPLVLSPPSGGYATGQALDLVITLYDHTLDFDSLELRVDGRRWRDLGSRCIAGRGSGGTRTLRCAGFSRGLKPGHRVLEVTARRRDGRMLSRTATWRIEVSVER